MNTLRLMRLVAFALLLLWAGTFSLPEPTNAAAGGVRQSASPAGSWLDRLPANWNRRMDRLPRPSAPAEVAEARRSCRGLVRPPNGPAERALARAGWGLYGPVKSNGRTKVVTALSGAEGMCRPIQYQAFVYWDGRYAGTLSPVAMDSRTDGALTDIRFDSPTSISAEFVRYAESDPLCCPSRKSQVTYKVRRDDAPLVTPVRIDTTAAGAPGEGEGSEDTSGDAAQLFGRRWMLVEVGGVVVRTGKPYIEFDRGAQRFSGDGGCNRISGGFEVNGRSLKFSRVISTRRACLDAGVQRVETEFLDRLERTNAFQIGGNTLRLYEGDTLVLTFKPDPGGSRPTR